MSEKQFLRKAFIPVWIEAEYEKTSTGQIIKKPGTGIRSETDMVPVTFHTWGLWESTPGIVESCAIVEHEDGTVESVLPENIKFATHESD